MSKNKLTELVREHGKKGSWVTNALYRRTNRKWLSYSSQVARRILAGIEDRTDLTQAELARKLDITPQQVSKIVKGRENLTLETIAKISSALEIELISFPEYKYSNSSLEDTEILVGTVGIAGSHHKTRIFISWDGNDAPIVPMWANTSAVSNEVTEVELSQAI